MRTAALLALLATAVVCSLGAVPAQAQRDRVFVASYGSDSNPCTYGSPCKTFQNAVDVVAAGGEVTAIDSAGFGPLTITKAVTITSPAGVEAGIVPNSGFDAVYIDTSGDVALRGLTIEGNDNGVDGIGLSNASSLAIVNCSIRHFTHDGIYLQPTGELALSILNTIASNNGNDGIDLSPSGGSGEIIGVIDHSTATSNTVDGMNVYGANAGGLVAEITIVNSVSANNGRDGVVAYTTAGNTATTVMVRDTTASYNAASGFLANGTAEMILAHSEATGNSYGIYINTDASGHSFGDNHVYGNLSNDVLGTLGGAGFH
jgi:hypothetical protein